MKKLLLNKTLAFGVSIFFLGQNFMTVGCAARDTTQHASVLANQNSAAEPTKKEPVASTYYCQNIGGVIGSASISFNANTVLHFYATPSSEQQPAQTLRFYEDTDLQMFSFRPEGPKSYSLLRPERHKLDYFLFDLSVVNRLDGWLQNWLEVVVDDTTKETLWVQESRCVKFENWLQTMENSFAVGRISIKGNPVREKPEMNAPVIDFDDRGCFKVTEMKGDWIRVIEQEHCSRKPGSSVSGWIRWRDDNGCLLVEIFAFA